MKLIINSKLINILKSFLALIIGSILGLLILEISLRAVGYIETNWNKFTLSHSKQKDELRILTLGDSMTKSEKYTYPDQLQSILSQNPKIDKKVTVINGGIPGSASQDILNHLEEYLDQYNPDIVVVMTGINVDGVYDRWANIQNDNGFNKLKSFKLIKYIYQNFISKINHDLGKKYSYYIYANENIKVDNIINSLRSKYSNQLNEKDIFENSTEKDLYQRLNSTEINKDKIYMELSDYYGSISNSEKQLTSALKALSINQNNSSAYIRLSADVTNILTLEVREKLLLKALEIDPNNVQPYVQLGRLYSENVAVSNINKYSLYKIKEKYIYKKGIEINPSSSDLWYWLGKYYFRYEYYSESEIAFKKAISYNSFESVNRISDTYQLLAKIYQSQNRDEEAKSAYIYSIESNDALANNYPIIAKTLKDRGIPLIAMQYPLRDVNILKTILKDYDVSYVDNKNSFETVIKDKGKEKVFVDLFAGDFGHCTAEGNRIMANNVAQAILESKIGIK